MTDHKEFRHPPVIETVLGVQFEQLPGLTNAHLGAFWGEIRADWPDAEDAPRLDDQREEFGGQRSWVSGLQLRVTQEPASRLRIKNKGGDRMVQVQNCRFDYNWLGHAGGDYPRYRAAVRPEFDRHLACFADFIGKNGLGELIPNQWEVTYVNHVPHGTVWAELEELAKVFRGLSGPAVTPSGFRLEGLGGHWHLEIEPQLGRLHVEVQHGRLGSQEGTETLVVKLTARGPMATDVDYHQAIDNGLNLGHDAIVKYFEETTSTEAQNYWDREP